MNKLKLAKTLLVAIALGMPMVFPSISYAKTETVQVKTEYTDQELIDLLKSEGYSAEKFKDGVIKIKANGRTMLLFNTYKGDLQIAFFVSNEITFSQANKWNEDKRLASLYRDSEGKAVLQSDLLADAGISKDQIKAFIKTFVNASVPTFSVFFKENN